MISSHHVNKMIFLECDLTHAAGTGTNVRDTLCLRSVMNWSASRGRTTTATLVPRILSRQCLGGVYRMVFSQTRGEFTGKRSVSAVLTAIYR